MKMVQRMIRGGIGAAAITVMAGCKSTPTVSPTTAPAEARAIPAAAVQHAPSLTDLTSGELGIGGGFLIGVAPEKLRSHQSQEAVAAARLAEQSPATIQLVRNSTTADLNHDGYVTLDEVLALVRSGLSDAEVANRLHDTGYIFHMTAEQERYLTDRGVSQQVVKSLHELSKT